MPIVLPTDFAPFFDLLTAQFVKTGVIIEAARVLPACDKPEDVPHYTSDREILLSPGDEVSDRETATGSGTLDTRSIATLYVIPRSRLELDEPGSDRRRLLEHLAFRAGIRSVIQMDWPEDAAANVYGVHPLRWVRTRAPVKERANRDWLYSLIEVEIYYPVLLNPRNP